jgi:hypothetical protein
MAFIDMFAGNLILITTNQETAIIGGVYFDLKISCCVWLKQCTN